MFCWPAGARADQILTTLIKKAEVSETSASSWLVARKKLASEGHAFGAGQPRSQTRDPQKNQSLGCSARPDGQVAYLCQDARHLHPVQLRHEWQNLRDEGILHQVPNLFLPAALAAGEQIGHGNFQRARQPLERRQRGCGLLVFDLGHVGPRYGHAGRELALAQSIAQAQGADGGREIQMPASVTVRGLDRRHGYRWYDFRLLFV